MDRRVVVCELKLTQMPCCNIYDVEKGGFSCVLLGNCSYQKDVRSRYRYQETDTRFPVSDPPPQDASPTGLSR